MVLGFAKKPSYSDRLAFLGLDIEDCSRGEALWVVVEPSIEGILEDFYAHVMRYAPKSLKKRLDVPRLSKAQKAHWHRLFTSYTSQDYLDAASRIASAHNDIGLSADWYIGGYAFIANRMTEKVLEHHADDPEAGRKAVQLLNGLIGLDIGTVMSIYQYE